MNGFTALYNLLSTDSAIVAIIGNKIRVAVKEPDSWGPTDSTISIYDPVGKDNGLDWNASEAACNCRAPSEKEAKALGAAVVDAANRVEISGGGRFYCTTGFLLQPDNELDSYNLPVTVRIRSNKGVA